MKKQEGNPPIAFPYATHLNTLFPHLEKIDVLALARDVKDQWYNQTLCQVNGSVIRLGVMQGEYHWHKHDNDDEFFFCLQGEFLVDLEGRTITLGPQQGGGRSEGRASQDSRSAEVHHSNGRECWDRADRGLTRPNEVRCAGR